MKKEEQLKHINGLIYECSGFTHFNSEEVKHFIKRCQMVIKKTRGESSPYLKKINVLSYTEEEIVNGSSTWTWHETLFGLLQTLKTEVELEETESEQAGESDNSISLIKLHPLVQQTAGQLYKDGHYRQAILDTYIMLVEEVKKKSGRNDLDNTPLMQQVFSPKTPILRVSPDADEQQGFMWLYTGAVMGIRNPKAHRIIEQKDPQRALEWLSFASVLLRILDDSTNS